MITVDQFLAFGLAAFILIAIPGPSVVFVIGRALAYGRGVALATVLGNTLGLLTIVVLVAFGLGVIVEESIVVFMVLKFAGAAYLVWLGVQAIRHRKAFSVQNAGVGGHPALTWRKVIRQGFIVGVSNPKAFMIIGAVLPQFIDRGNGHVQAQMLLLGLIAVTIGLLSDSLWAVIASQLRTWFHASPKRGEAMGAVGGTSMIGLGVGLAVSGNHH
ncbi:LysE family translocator [Aeromicrobium ginsengisoli]|uniref:LysE family translocator n=1 Tax=Aeromicrobium ginsengisoli TaxID=363867 RepID=A0A5M4FD95_9ACTN|nr:LysE family translocator [Aeromicrobium ginsengisoli]KAA1397166.1 LysE family translocator [Aeromicrobium ginsengisoli]